MSPLHGLPIHPEEITQHKTFFLLKFTTINKAIVIQHLYSPAMWAVFQLQDLMGVDADLRRSDPSEERINIPSNPKHYWRYRMHMTLEELMKEKDFNHSLKEYIKAGGRA